jgi:hypothetical protein
MSVEVKNLQSGETFNVGLDGLIIGRQGGGADVQVEDRSVSKKHCRLFSDGASWFLEDMGSVNGTVVDGNKIGAAVPLQSGLIFSISKHRFEILRVPGKGRSAVVAAPPEVETRTAMRHNGQNAQNLPSDLRKDPIPKKRAAAPPPRPFDDDLAPVPSEPTNRGNNLPLASDQDFPSEALPSFVAGSPDGAGDGAVLGIDQYEDLSPGEALTLGISYAMKTTPMLALKLIGTVKSHIEHPPLPALEKVPLAMAVLPASVVLITIAMGADAIAAAFAGNFSLVSFLVAPIAGVIGGAIGALLLGFLGHVILSWVIDKLGGSSDARSRTAHLAMGVATSLVLLLPQVLSTILTGVIARLMSVASAFSLLMIIPALIGLIATPLPMYVQWCWWKSYGVAKWFQTLIGVLTAVLLLFGVAGCISTIAGAVSAMRAGGSAVVSSELPSAVTGSPATPPVPTVPGPTASTPTVSEPAATVPTVPTPPPLPTVPTPVPTVPATPSTPGAAVAAGAVAVRVDEGYAVYTQKRADIDALLERDPTILNRSEQANALYRSFLERGSDAENDVFNDFGKGKRSQALNPMYDKAKKAKVYERTRTVVDKLHGVLFGP